MKQKVLEGNGWRLGWNPEADNFRGLIAGPDWALELTAAELKDFCRLARQLDSTMNAMTVQLVDEERLSCEQETQIVWLEAEGFPTCYGLRFILLTGRKCEGEWPPDVVPQLISALDQLPFRDL
ncbi:hypothetical protein S7335_4684 [Synechococcus sp. PCC 7335]|uniref:DUF1818 family protein n=1 Tax=Synechococcus sp. (strain ATCC 29403 / PCC 7335) TaxID=91464 RepID=UPI00017EE06B|nr:DUF1818 family protein [Synechococcus sp. PCC 7335]EDX86977.1 hypothetical protein S7335_4684 [Synechococcus sp. PCC 7335]